VVGNSMGAASAVLVGVQRPDLVIGLVLVGPFVRNPKTGALQRSLLRVAMARPWVATTWKAYLPRGRALSAIAATRPHDRRNSAFSADIGPP
jgi:pimeloyl-ACP methyl ester carboxylesterase